MSGEAYTTGGRPDYDAMQRDIHERQARIATALDALKRRLNPGHIKETTMNRMSRRTRHGSSSVTGVVRSNPMPLALIGVGIGWLVLSQSGYGERVGHSGAARRAGNAAQSAREGLYHAGESARHSASSAYERASRSVRSAAERIRGQSHEDSPETGSRYGTYTGGGGTTHAARERMGRAAHGFWDMVEDHPVVAGIMGLALGAALGASIPSSRYEDEWIGEYSDEAYDRAKHYAEDTMDRSTRAARAAYDAAREDVAEAVGDAKDAAREEMNKPS